MAYCTLSFTSGIYNLAAKLCTIVCIHTKEMIIQILGHGYELDIIIISYGLR